MKNYINKTILLAVGFVGFSGLKAMDRSSTAQTTTQSSFSFQPVPGTNTFNFGNNFSQPLPRSTTATTFDYTKSPLFGKNLGNSKDFIKIFKNFDFSTIKDRTEVMHAGMAAIDYPNYLSNQTYLKIYNSLHLRDHLSTPIHLPDESTTTLNKCFLNQTNLRIERIGENNQRDKLLNWASKYWYAGVPFAIGGTLVALHQLIDYDSDQIWKPLTAVTVASTGFAWSTTPKWQTELRRLQGLKALIEEKEKTLELYPTNSSINKFNQ